MYIRKPCGASNNNRKFTSPVHQLEPEVHQVKFTSQNKKFISPCLSSFGSLCAQCAQLVIRLQCLLSIITLIIFTRRKNILCVGIPYIPHVNSVIV
jgi:hypothetical protein